MVWWIFTKEYKDTIFKNLFSKKTYSAKKHETRVEASSCSFDSNMFIILMRMGSIFHEGWYRENPMQNYSAWKAESCVKDVQINHQTMILWRKVWQQRGNLNRNGEKYSFKYWNNKSCLFFSMKVIR